MYIPYKGNRALPVMVGGSNFVFSFSVLSYKMQPNQVLESFRMETQIFFLKNIVSQLF